MRSQEVGIDLTENKQSPHPSLPTPPTKSDGEIFCNQLKGKGGDRKKAAAANC